MKIRFTVLSVLIPALGFAFPPGSPMSEFGPSQISLGAFFDHSGQDLFEDGYPSVLNSTGLSLDYAPWTFVQMGVFGGGGELDIGIPDGKLSDSSVHAYNTDYNVYGGASGKLATPRFGANTTRAVAFGSAAYLNSSDAFGNSKMVLIYNAGATAQFIFWNKLNFVVGAEFYAWEGEQKSARGKIEPFGVSASTGIGDYFRGIVGVEYFFKGANRPFISIAVRPTGNLGWNDDLGLRNASISVSLGAMTSLGKAKVEAGEDEPSLTDE
jgi:hypothetical protein